MWPRRSRIEETLNDAPGGVAEKPYDGHEQQRPAKRLSEDGCERAARPRDASACSGCDLEGQRADDHVEHTFHKEAPSGEPLDCAETVHGFIGTPYSYEFDEPPCNRSQSSPTRATSTLAQSLELLLQRIELVIVKRLELNEL